MSSPAKYATLFVGCVIFHLLGTWSLPLVDRDEPRFAEASREMIERHDYVIPYFNNQFRFDKPPLTYWAQIASYKIFGENDFGARFPSAIAAGLIALSIVVRGKHIGGERVAWFAAIIFTLCLQTFIHAKAAVADMWLALFVTMAHWSGIELLGFGNRQSNFENPQSAMRDRQWPWWFIFYISLALGFLAKGPIAWAPLLTVASTKLYAPELSLCRRFKFVRGILFMLALVSLWGIPALLRTHGEFFRIGIGRHVIGRSFGAMEGHGANSLGLYFLVLPFYFITVFASFFPWSIKLPALAKRLWKTRNNIDNYLISGVIIIFIIFSLVKTKLPHYTLPAFGLLALLLARHWPAQQTRLFQWITAATLAVLAAIALLVPPVIAASFPAYDLYQKARNSLQPEMEFGAVDYQEPSLVWYFRSRVRGFMTPLNKKRAADFMSRPGPRFLVESSPAPLASDLSPGWERFSTEGFNIPKGKKVDLTLVMKPQ
ncbi:MAG TPA: glycosyltransferase family 39 protein [Chthoniobacterales bacterium]|nr:glycosyltransferase family 39 protein [Chthoniobacterales bacterium]